MIVIDHITIIVNNIYQARDYYQKFGFQTIQDIRTKKGVPGTLVCVLILGVVTFVLLQATEDNYLTEHIKQYGGGVHHIALRTDDLATKYDILIENNIAFSTPIVEGKNLKQVLTETDKNSSIIIEIIERKNKNYYELEEENVNILIDALAQNAT